MITVYSSNRRGRTTRTFVGRFQQSLAVHMRLKEGCVHLTVPTYLAVESLIYAAGFTQRALGQKLKQLAMGLYWT
jgi:hypothetical protein